MDISRYVLVRADNVELDVEYESYDEAYNEAIDLGYAVVERHYTYSDSELVYPDTWPPKAQKGA